MRCARSACTPSWPHSTIDSTFRPPNWFCTAAIVRRISASRAGNGGGSPLKRVVRRKTALPSTTAVRSASSANRSTRSRNCAGGTDLSPANSDAASHGRSRSRRIFSPACWQTPSICWIIAGAMAVANTVRGPSGALVDGHEVQQPVLVQLVELAGRLEVDHVGQVFVGGGRQLELTQLDAAASHGHQGLGTPDAPGVEFLGDPLADALLGLIRLRAFLVPGDREGVFDHDRRSRARRPRPRGSSRLFHSRARS